MNNRIPKYEPLLNVKIMRVKKNMTLRDLSIKSGIQEGLLSGYEKGIHAPSLAQMRRIANALECPLSEIV